jgi:hypothetical protein
LQSRVTVFKTRAGLRPRRLSLEHANAGRGWGWSLLTGKGCLGLLGLGFEGVMRWADDQTVPLRDGRAVLLLDDVREFVG